MIPTKFRFSSLRIKIDPFTFWVSSPWTPTPPALVFSEVSVSPKKSQEKPKKYQFLLKIPRVNP